MVNSICCIMIDILTDKNPEATSGITPLHWSAKNGHLEICKLIMKNVIDKNHSTGVNGDIPYQNLHLYYLVKGW